MDSDTAIQRPGFYLMLPTVPFAAVQRPLPVPVDGHFPEN